MDKGDFKILVADDDELTREMLEGVLREEGYPVISAADGTDAIRMLKLEEVSMVFTDYRMPTADGIEVLKHARRLNHDVYVVILTAYGSIDTILETIREGAFDYIAKPFNRLQITHAANKAYQRAVLIEDNRELVKQLRESYKDEETVKSTASGIAPNAVLNLLDRLGRLVSLDVLNEDEADQIKKRLIKGA